MFTFKVQKIGNQVIINEKHRYTEGEILSAYLHQDFSKLQKKYHEILKLESRVLFPFSKVSDYNEVIHKAQGFFSYIDNLIIKLPPFDKIIMSEHYRSNELYCLLSSERELFRDDGEYEDEGEVYVPQDDEMSDYDYDVDDEKDFEARYRNKIDWEISEDKEDNLLKYYDIYYVSPDDEWVIVELNKKIKKLYDMYMTTAAELLRVPNVYAKLIGEMENSQNYAETYGRFQKEQRPSQVYDRLEGAHNVMVYYEAAEMADSTSRQAFCQTNVYQGIGSFLYMELMDCIRSGNLPK